MLYTQARSAASDARPYAYGPRRQRGREEPLWSTDQVSSYRPAPRRHRCALCGSDLQGRAGLGGTQGRKERTAASLPSVRSTSREEIRNWPPRFEPPLLLISFTILSVQPPHSVLKGPMTHEERPLQAGMTSVHFSVNTGPQHWWEERTVQHAPRAPRPAPAQRGAQVQRRTGWTELQISGPLIFLKQQFHRALRKSIEL